MRRVKQGLLLQVGASTHCFGMLALLGGSVMLRMALLSNRSTNLAGA